MTRIAWILTSLVAVLAGALWFLLLYSPTSEQIEEVRASTAQAETDAVNLRQQAAQLRQVRESAPEAEAQIAAGRALLPEESSMPAMLRQLQAAADESGARLVAVAPSAPNATDAAGNPIVSIAIQVEVEGTYFQLVDMARRLEDPTITARGWKWRNASLVPVGGEDAGVTLLTASLSGEIFARDGFAVDAATDAAAGDVAPDGGAVEDGEPVQDGAPTAEVADPVVSDDPESPQPLDGGPAVEEGEIR